MGSRWGEALKHARGFVGEWGGVMVWGMLDPGMFLRGSLRNWKRRFLRRRVLLNGIGMLGKVVVMDLRLVGARLELWLRFICLWSIYRRGFKFSNQLSRLLSLKQDSKESFFMAVWQYVKREKSQCVDGRALIRFDDD